MDNNCQAKEEKGTEEELSVITDNDDCGSVEDKDSDLQCETEIDLDIGKLTSEQIKIIVDKYCDSIRGTDDKSQSIEKKILVLSGGGTKGISHIGALAALEELNILSGIETFVGVSAGAMITGLHVLGYSPAELFEFVKVFELNKMKSLNFMGIFKSFGIDDGANLEYIIKRMVSAKGYGEHATLKEIYDKTNKEMIFISTCLNSKSICEISYKTHPDIPLYTAIRMSSAVPLYFVPVSYQGNIYVDGGCMNNYPIHMFNDRIDSVIGILIEEDDSEIQKIDNFESYIYQTLKSVSKALDCLSKNGYEENTIIIPTSGISTLDYNIGEEQKDIMYKTGYNCTKKFFNQ